MAEEKVTSEITPALSMNVAFTDKVSAVDVALKDRATAQRDIKIKWAEIVKLLVQDKMSVPGRRADIQVVVSYVPSVVIYQPDDPRLSDKTRVLAAQQCAYNLGQACQSRAFMALAETQLPGYAKLVEEMLDLAELSNRPRLVDDAATKTARDEMQKAVDAYIQAVEAYEETVEKVADVKEYISVVKDVAEISAIAQGSRNGEIK